MPDNWRTFSTRSDLGGALLAQKEYSNAEQLLRSGYEGMKAREASIPATSKVGMKQALDRLVKIYEATDRPEQAAECRLKLEEFDRVRTGETTTPSAKPPP